VKHAFLDRFAKISSPIHRLEPRVKIIVFVGVLLISLSTPPGHFRAFGAYVAVLLTLALVSRVPVSFLAKRASIVLPLVFLMTIFLPFFPRGTEKETVALLGINLSKEGLLLAWNICVKSFVGVISLLLLVTTTPFDRLMRAFESLKVPKLFTLLSSFAYRYIFVIVDEAMRMKRAKDLRTFKREALPQARSIGNLIGLLFLRSYERSERIFRAMCARGFQGKFDYARLPAPGIVDVAVAGCILTFAVLIRALLK